MPALPAAAPASAVPIPLVSRYTYRHHARASMLEGVLAGILVTTGVVAVKSLGADQWQVVILTMAPAALQVTAVLLARPVAAVDRGRFFLAAGVVGRLVLLLTAFVAGPWAFIAVLLVHGAVQSLVVPAQNLIYQSNYAPSVRGRLFGRASVLGGLTTAAVALAVGPLLDQDRQAYRWVYPLAGVAGFLSCLSYGAIRLRRHEGMEAGIGGVGEAGNGSKEREEGAGPVAIVRETLVRDVRFRRFEAAMFVYGLGFMCMQPVFAPFMANELRMSYSDATQAAGVMFYAVHVAALGFSGRLYDRIGLERLSMAGCLILSLFAGSMGLSSSPLQVKAAFGLYGLGMAAINIVWSMGPAHYAPPGAANRYMAVHVGLVGLRAVVGQPLGGWLADEFGSARPAFAASAAFFAVAIALMLHARRSTTPPVRDGGAARNVCK